MAIKGSLSEERLAGLDPDLRDCVRLLGCRMNIVVVEGLRSISRQKQLFNSPDRRTKTLISKHLPNSRGYSEAVDLAPCDEEGNIDWSDMKAFGFMAGMLIIIGNIKGIDIRWGGDWDRDGDLEDQDFDDLLHFEKFRRIL